MQTVWGGIQPCSTSSTSSAQNLIGTSYYHKGAAGKLQFTLQGGTLATSTPAACHWGRDSQASRVALLGSSAAAQQGTEVGCQRCKHRLAIYPYTGRDTVQQDSHAPRSRTPCVRRITRVLPALQVVSR